MSANLDLTNDMDDNMSTAQNNRAGQMSTLRAGLLGILLTLGLSLVYGPAQAAGQAPVKTGPGAPIFTVGNPAYKGISNAQSNVSANAPAGAAANLTGMVNQPPVIAWSTPANTVVTAPASFALTVNASDPDGTVAKVDYYNGTTLIGTTTAAPYSFTWSNVAAGNYTLTAVATDNLGMSTTSGTLPVISNAAPSVGLTTPAANTVATAPGSFSLSASAADSDGTVTKVDYYANGTLIGSASAAPYSFTWSNVAAGSYSLTAIATDNYGASTTSAAVSVISNAPPTASLTAPANNSILTVPANITLTAKAADSDGTVARVDFYDNGRLLGTSTTAPYGYTWNNAPAGVHQITVAATDNLGASTTSSAITLTVNIPPTVNLTGPAANAVSIAPGSFALSANAADTDGTVAKVEFYANNGSSNTLVGTATSAPYTFAWTNVPAGTYTITAKATDNLGATTTSSAVSVTADALPTVNLTGPAANAISIAPGSFTLTATAASTTSTISKVDFYANNGTTNTLVGATTASNGSYSYTWTNVPAGSYSLTAVTTDALGITATSAAVNVTSDQPPAVTLTSPAAGAQITSGNSFSLSATASSTTSSISKVEFYANNGSSNTLVGTATSASNGSYNVTWNNVPVGSYSLTAVATDALGTTTTSGATSVTAIANVPPTVSLTSPANGATVKASGSFTLTATATSTTSTVSKVDFYANNGTGNTLVGTATTAPYSYTWSNVALGSYTITAVATDTLNATTTSASVTVTVNTGSVQAYYIHADQLDTPRQITDTAGNVVWQWDNSDPFGNNPPNENPSGQGQYTYNLRQPGQYFDIETGLFYNINRYYDPSIGRYTQSDPIGLAGGSYSTYAYVNGNPLSYVDPYGLWSWSSLWKPAKEVICKGVDGANKANDWGQNARMQGEFDLWKLNQETISNTLQNEIAMCVKLITPPANQCPVENPRDKCIEEAARKAAEARRMEDDRHNSTMTDLIRPSNSQIVGGWAGEICSAL